MNLFNILSELEKIDPEIMDRLNHRRSALSKLGDISKKMALAAAPIAIGSAFNKSMGANTLTNANAVLNYALLLERIEEAFYIQALAAPTLAATLTGDARTAITTIKNHESAHVALLTKALGNAADPAPANGFNFDGAFATYPTFLIYAQAFEDTGVRAYKGQAGVLIGTPTLTTALQIHSVEARHASHVRYMRRATGANTQYGWIINSEANGAPDAVYGAGSPIADFPAESNVMQAGLTLTTIGGTTYAAADVSAAFDEPLDNESVVKIAKSVVAF